MNLQPGQIIHVRSRKYLVEEVVPPPEPADSPLVRLSCVEDDALGESLEVLWDKEIDARVIDEANWQAIASCGGSRTLMRPEHLPYVLPAEKWRRYDG